MMKPWIILLWAAVFGFATWLWSEGERWEALGVLATGTFWEIIHFFDRRAKSE